MEVDVAQMRRAGMKIRTIGMDAQNYLAREKGSLEFGSQGNEGFATMAALKSAVDKLHRQSSRLAADSQETAANVNRAADAHQVNERAQADNFTNNLNALTSLVGP